MRKVYISVLTLLLLLVVTGANAQVNTYVFAQSSGTYTPITAGTVVVTATAATGAGSLDDNTYTMPAGTIPFTFTFNGIGYTGFNINTNGFISFGATVPAGASYTPISATTTYDGAIAAWGGDINSVWTLAGVTGDIRYQVVGSAPNREMVIQWTNFRPSYTTSTTAGYVFDFQIRLAESSNAIKVVYGGTLANIIGTTTFSGTRQIGLRGLTNADYNNRLNATTTAFTASTAGTANSSTQAWNTVTNPPGMPTSGLTYMWLPPPPCVPGSLGGGTTQSTTASACPSSPFTLSVTGASFGAGLTYQWESSATGLPGSFAPIAGATATTYIVASQTSATYYHRKMTCSGTDAFSTDLLITQNPPTTCYCNAGLTTFVNGIDIVTNVKVTNAAGATLIQASTSNGTTNYQQYNNTPLDLARTTTNSLAITFGTDGTQYSAAWIDYNQDGIFSASENIALAASAAGGSATVTYNFVVPIGATLGNTRLRVRGGSDNAYTAAGACTNTNYGETEDYLVNITAAPPCIAPTGVSIGTITANSAVVTFTAAGTTYLEYGPAGFIPGSGATAGAGTLINPATSPQAIGGLAANTLYDVYVRTACAGGIFSTNTGPISFQTLCNAIASFPYTETYETSSPTRACWTPTIVSGSVNWTYGAGAGNGGNVTTAHGGTVNARHFGFGTGSVARLVSPALNFSGMPAQGAQVTFWYANQNWLGDQNQLRVYYKTTAAGAWTLIPGAVYTTDVGAWTEVELVLPSSTGPTDYYIAFEGTELFGWGVAVDDVTIAAAPSCPKPTAVTAVAVSPTDAIVSFTSPGTAFIVEYGAPGFIPGTTNTAGGGQLVFGGSSPITVPGLTPNTAYDFYVRRICVPGVDFSANVKATATTLCNATNIPYVQNFESSVVPAPPTCTSVQDLNGNSGSVPNSGGGSWYTYDGGTNVQTFVSPTKTIRYLYDAGNSTRPADDWFYTQGLNLTGGTNYRLKFFIKASDGPTWTERLEVKYGTLAHSSAMTNLLYTNNNIATALASPWDSVIVDFSPATSGVYYVGFHAMSLADQAFLYLDDVSVKLAPLVDVGVTAVTLPTLNCPTNNVFLQATVTNFNTTPQNFATYPVTVTANITGAATGTLTATLNTGTLAPGASMIIYLSPSFNFSTGGIYNINVATSSPVDPETGNDAITTSVTVNPTPPTPIITPANPAVCAGTPVLLSTQFTPSPPPVVLPAVSSGTISVPVPDGTPAGTSHTLVVNTVPAGAVVTGISVTINMTHTWIGDMIINLKAPNGNVLNLINQEGGSGDNLSGTVITSAAGAGSLALGTAPFTGTFAPDANAANPPTAFPQTPATATNFNPLMSQGNGSWILALRDNAGLDVGTLTSWSITLTYQILTPTITWTPATGLFTNAGATTAYTGGNAYSLYANPAGTTTYNVTATTAAGCTSSASTTVTVNPYPVIAVGSIPDTVCISDPIIALTASPVGGSWSGPGVSGANFIPPSTAVGTYTLTYTYTSPAGCTTTATKKIAVKDCPERMILLRDNALILYPNPNTGQFNIRVNSVLYNNLVMKVYTSHGALVRTQQLGGLAWGRVVSIDLTTLPGGVYMVKFYYDGGIRTAEKTFKVVIATP
jgi:subtilisin-like proprotein convertase family protein